MISGHWWAEYRDCKTSYSLATPQHSYLTHTWSKITLFGSQKLKWSTSTLLLMGGEQLYSEFGWLVTVCILGCSVLAKWSLKEWVKIIHSKYNVTLLIMTFSLTSPAQHSRSLIPTVTYCIIIQHSLSLLFSFTYSVLFISIEAWQDLCK